MPEQFGDKTQDATPHRRQKAREEGHVAKSQDLSSAIVLVGALLAIKWMGPGIARFAGNLLVLQLGSPALLTADRGTALLQWHQTVVGLAGAIVPFLMVLLIVAVLSQLGQVGFLFLPKKLSLDFSRLNPLKGLGRMFSIQNGVRLIFGIFKILVVVVVAAMNIWSRRNTLLGLIDFDFGDQVLAIVDLTMDTCLRMAVALLILAVLDFAFQRWKYEQDLKMTTQEVREEYKNLQGDPQIQARRRQVQRQMVLTRLNTVIPTADVVVTNPTELAVAIRYDEKTMAAPIVVAKGADLLAARIRRLALENSVPIVERKELARALYKEVDINQPIPSAQYAAVAEVLKYVYELKGIRRPEAA